MILRRYYTSSNTATLKQLYLSFVRPHLEYAAQVWDPHLRTHINSLERVQKFALRMCCKNWNEPYDALLARTDLPTLSKRRKFLKVSYFFQVYNKRYIPFSQCPYHYSSHQHKIKELFYHSPEANICSNRHLYTNFHLSKYNYGITFLMT